MLRKLLTGVADWVRVVPRGWRYAAIAGVLVLVVLTGSRLVRGGSSPATGTATTVTGRAAPGPQAEGARMLRRDGNAVLGVLRSTDGAAAAALNYTVQRNALLTGGTTSAVAAEVGSKLALGGYDIGDRPASIPDRAAGQNAEAMLATRRGSLHWVTVPTGYRLLRYAGRRAVVRVYSSLLDVGASTDQGAAAMSYALRDIDLRWSGGAWRIRSVQDAPDQPTPALLVATRSDQDGAKLAVRDRIIPATTSGASGLFDWLSGATPVSVGPQGMGPIDGRALAGPDGTMVSELSRGFRDRPRPTAPGSAWSSVTPVAFRRMACPAGADGVVCFGVLLFSSSFRGRGVAVSSLELVGFAVSAAPGSTGAMRFDVPEDVQTRVLAGQLTIPVAGLPDTRTTNAAWRRSIVPLRPTVPGTAR